MDTLPLPLRLLEYRHEGRGRMAAALLLSLAAHAALLAWHGAPPAPPATQSSTLEVTLVNSRSEQAPLNPQALAQQDLDGKKDIPHELLVPYLAFTQDDFEKALPNIPKGGAASHEYTQQDAIAAIKANMK